jgi:hypothetical protein
VGECDIVKFWKEYVFQEGICIHSHKKFLRDQIKIYKSELNFKLWLMGRKILGRARSYNFFTLFEILSLDWPPTFSGIIAAMSTQGLNKRTQ